MDAESKERGRDYLAADIFLTAARFGGDAAINRLPKETLRRARRFLVRVNGAPACDESGSSLDRFVSLPVDISANHSSGRSSAGGDNGAAR
jgi:hypothetical protein